MHWIGDSFLVHCNWCFGWFGSLRYLRFPKVYLLLKQPLDSKNVLRSKEENRKAFQLQMHLLSACFNERNDVSLIWNRCFGMKPAYGMKNYLQIILFVIQIVQNLNRIHKSGYKI